MFLISILGSLVEFQEYQVDKTNWNFADKENVHCIYLGEITLMVQADMENIAVLHK